MDRARAVSLKSEPVFTTRRLLYVLAGAGMVGLVCGRIAFGALGWRPSFLPPARQGGPANAEARFAEATPTLRVAFRTALPITAPPSQAAAPTSTVIPTPPGRATAASQDTGMQAATEGATLLQKVGPFTFLLATLDPFNLPPPGANRGAFVLGRMDAERRIVSWVALPADLPLQVPGSSTERLDAVYGLGEQLQGGGGAPFLKQVLEQNLQIPVNYFLIVTGGTLAQAIERTGPLTITIPYALNEPDPASSAITATAGLRAGKQALDGASLFEYLRARDRASDPDHLRKLSAVLEALDREGGQPAALQTVLSLLVDPHATYQTNLSLKALLGLVLLTQSIPPEQNGLRQIDSTMYVPAPGAKDSGSRWEKIRPLFSDWKH